MLTYTVRLFTLHKHRVGVGGWELKICGRDVCACSVCVKSCERNKKKGRKRGKQEGREGGKEEAKEERRRVDRRKGGRNKYTPSLLIWEVWKLRHSEGP